MFSTLDQEVFPMPTTLTITLDSELSDALNRKSHRLDLAPEDVVRQLVQSFVQGRIVLPDQEFAEGLTIAGYLALNNEEEEALWDRWFAEADQQVGNIMAEAGPNAVPPR
jgi:hypothetical protein